VQDAFDAMLSQLERAVAGWHEAEEARQRLQARLDQLTGANGNGEGQERDRANGGEVQNEPHQDEQRAQAPGHQFGEPVKEKSEENAEEKERAKASDDINGKMESANKDSQDGARRSRGAPEARADEGGRDVAREAAIPEENVRAQAPARVADPNARFKEAEKPEAARREESKDSSMQTGGLDKRSGRLSQPAAQPPADLKPPQGEGWGVGMDPVALRVGGNRPAADPLGDARAPQRENPAQFEEKQLGQQNVVSNAAQRGEGREREEKVVHEAQAVGGGLVMLDEGAKVAKRVEEKPPGAAAPMGGNVPEQQQGGKDLQGGWGMRSKPQEPQAGKELRGGWGMQDKPQEPQGGERLVAAVQALERGQAAPVQGGRPVVDGGQQLADPDAGQRRGAGWGERPAARGDGRQREQVQDGQMSRLEKEDLEMAMVPLKELQQRGEGRA
jgi:hypothetical protein